MNLFTSAMIGVVILCAVVALLGFFLLFPVVASGLIALALVTLMVHSFRGFLT